MTTFDDLPLYLEAHQAAFKFEEEKSIKFTQEELKEFVINYIRIAKSHPA